MDLKTEREEMPENTMKDADGQAVLDPAEGAPAAEVPCQEGAEGEAVSEPQAELQAVEPQTEPQAEPQAEQAADEAGESPAEEAPEAMNEGEEAPVEAAEGEPTAEAPEAGEQGEAPEAAPAEEAAEAAPDAAPAEAAPAEEAAEAAPDAAQEAEAAEAPQEQTAEAEEADGPRVKARATAGTVIGNIVLAILCIIFIPLLCINVTLIIKGAIYPDEMPDVFNIAPVAVEKSNSTMAGEREGCFDPGALVFIQTFDTDEERQSIEVGDVVAFRWIDDEADAGSETKFSVYRVLGLIRDEETGLITSASLRVDNVPEGEGEAPVPVEIEDICGIYRGSVPHLGAFALFLMEPIGVLLFVGVPVLLYVVIDLIRITVHNRKVRKAESEEIKDKDEEIARLRALVAGGAVVPVPAEGEPVLAEEIPEGEPVLAEEIPEGEPAVPVEGEIYDEPVPEPTDETAEGEMLDEAPAEITDEPAEIADEPAELTDEPAEIADEPAEIADEPAELTDEPAEIADEPAEIADEPAELTDET